MQTLSQTLKRTAIAGTRRRTARPLRLATYLAPKLHWFYRLVSRHLAKKLHHPTELSVGTDYAHLSEQPDIAFLCGLSYVEHARSGAARFEPLVAPVLSGERYRGKPIYFSDVIVRRDSPFRSFADLRGCSWAYNEPLSQSGYGITRYYLASKRETNGYFSRVIEAGCHERAILMVLSGEVDASAIDSHLLALVMRDQPAIADGLRIIDALGPSPIQPIVAGLHLSMSLKSEVKMVLLEMGDDQGMKHLFGRALVERFEPVSDAAYDAIRRMQAVAEAEGFLTIR